MAAALAQKERLGDAAALAQLQVAPMAEFLHGMLGEEGPVHALGGGLFRQGLGAVLAVLAQAAAVLGVGPGAAGTVEAVLLVHPVQDLDAVHYAGLLLDMGQRLHHGGHAGRAVLAFGKREPGVAVGRQQGDLAGIHGAKEVACVWR
jgi:hypothetical protein